MSGGGVACVSNIDLWKMMIDYIEDYMQNVCLDVHFYLIINFDSDRIS